MANICTHWSEDQCVRIWEGLKSLVFSRQTLKKAGFTYLSFGTVHAHMYSEAKVPASSVHSPGGMDFMKKVLPSIVFLALCFALAGVAKADTCASNTNCLATGGVTFTFTNGGSDGSGGFLVDMVVSGNVSTADVFNSFSVQITSGATFGTVASVVGPSGTGNWVVEGLGPNTANGCNVNGAANHWCIDGGGISFPASGTFTFVLDVTGLPGAPTGADLQAFQSPAGIEGISAPTGIGGPPTTTPEPASMLLLGLGLVGAPLLRRRRS